jgi:hypothetical protein
MQTQPASTIASITHQRITHFRRSAQPRPSHRRCVVSTPVTYENVFANPCLVSGGLSGWTVESYAVGNDCTSNVSSAQAHSGPYSYMFGWSNVDSVGLFLQQDVEPSQVLRRSIRYGGCEVTVRRTAFSSSTSHPSRLLVTCTRERLYRGWRSSRGLKFHQPLWHWCRKDLSRYNSCATREIAGRTQSILTISSSRESLEI